MSTTSLNFHGVTEAKAAIHCADSCQWLSLDFTDRNGANLGIALFSDSPEEILGAVSAAYAASENAALREALRRLHDWALAQQGDCMFSGDHPIAQAAAALAKDAA